MSGEGARIRGVDDAEFERLTREVGRLRMRFDELFAARMEAERTELDRAYADGWRDGYRAALSPPREPVGA